MMRDLILKSKNILNFKVILLLILLLLGSFVFSPKAYALDMKIDDVSITDESSTISTDIPTHGNNNIDGNITFNKINDYVYYEVTIKNNTGYDYNIDSVTDNNKNKNISISYEKEEKVTAGSTTKLVIKMNYKKQLLNIEEITIKDLTIILNLSRENGEKEQMIINPKTLTQGTNYFWLLVLITIISGIILIANRKLKDKKINIGLIIIALLLIPSFAMAIERYQYKFTFDDIVVKGEFETYDVVVNVDGTETTRSITYGDPIGPLPAVSKEGYNFKRWVDDRGNTVTEDTIVRRAMTITPEFEAIKYDITYDLDGGSVSGNPTKYTIENEITLKNPTKQGFVFTGWTGSNGTNPQTNVTIPVGTTGDLTYTAHYEAGQETPYKVHHRYQNINGTYTTETENLTGVTGSTVKPATKGKTGFTSPEEENLEIKADGSSELTYTYTRNKYMLTITHPEYVEGESKEYYYEEQVTLKAKDRTGYTFIKWSNNETTKQITLQILGDTTIDAIYQINEYTITFDSNGGSSVGDIHKNYNEQIGTLPTSDRNTYVFDGWFTAKTGGEKITTTTLVTEDKTYFAHWTPNIDQATITPTELTLTAEEAGTITVTGVTGMESYTFASTDTDVVTVDQNGHVTAIAKGTAKITITGSKSGIVKEVPITVNPIIYTITFNPNEGTLDDPDEATRDIEKGDQVGTLPAATRNTYVLDGWYTNSTSGTKISATTVPAGTTTYFAHWIADVTHATVSPNSLDLIAEDEENITITGPSNMEGYTFSSSDTDIVTVDQNGHVTAVAKGTATITIIGTKSGKTKTISVNVDPITYTITFNPNGGTLNDPNDATKDVEKGDAVGALPVVTKTDNLFDGWFTQSSGGTQVNTNTVPEGTTTYFAHWTPNINNATITPTELTLTAEEAGTITVTGVTGMESYTFASTDTDVVTVDQNGHVTAVTKGTAKITITGSKSGIVKEIPVTVYPIIYTITFNPNGGTLDDPDEATRDIEKGDAVGTLPSASKANNTFDGWFTESTGGTQITTSTVPTGTATYFAHWTETPVEILCRKATVLKTEECESGVTSSQGCRRSHNVGDIITYGNIVDNDNYSAGDAFDCNVDGTGYNQRFYYLRTDNNTAILISNNNFEGQSGQINTDNFVYSDALDQLPVKTQWNKLDVIEDNRVARLITMDDLFAVTGTSSVNELTTNDSLANYTFLFENSGYAHSGGRSTQWIEEVSETDRYRIHKSAVYIIKIASSEVNTSKNCVRPVIEIPLAAIEDAYVVRFNPVGGTITNEYVRVPRGSALSTLPTPTKEGYLFDKWYAEAEYTHAITDSTVPAGYDTYYAKWVKSLATATLVHDTYTLPIGDTEQIEFIDSTDLEPVTYLSSDDSIATVTSAGVINTHAEGTATITITGTVSGTTKTVTVHVESGTIMHTITFDANGGTLDDPDEATREVESGTQIGTLPTATRTDYTFDGWCTDNTCTTKVTATTVVTGDMDLIAKWAIANPAARTNGVDYATLQAAIDAVPTDAKKTTVILLKNVSENVKVLDGRNVYLDLNGFTASNTTVSTQVFTVGVEDDSSNPVSTLELVNGKVTSNKASGMINVNKNCILKVSTGAELKATGTRQAIYTKGGTTYIYDGASLSSTADARATVHVLASGTAVILGGTITSTGAYALYNENGTLTIGEKDGVIDATTPVIQGKTYGIVAYSTYSFYDGIIKAQTAVSGKATNTGTTPNVVVDTDETKLTDKENNSTKQYGTETIGGQTYNTLYLSTTASNKYKIDFEANGGTFANSSDATRYVEPGDEVGTLPTITKGIYTFDGWYADSGFNTQVSATTIPTESTTYYAKWSYQASNTVVPFDITKDVMTTYYNNINTWKNDQTTFQTNMDTNFNNYSCSACNGANDCSTPSAGDKCDQSRGYDTGVGASISVYESDEVNKTKGNLVTYTTSTDGIIYNMIPGEVYYWEADSDSNVHGLVKALGKRRIINTTVRNIRDLGGLEVDTDNDGTVDGTLKYGRMFRGTKLANSTDIANLEKLGINLEVDLRGATEGASDPKLTNYIPREITNYLINNDTYPTNYATFRQAMIDTMQDIIDDRNIYFHCRIGTDRTGTMAYFLEGLLGVAEEDRLEDYELSYFYGLTNRHRFHDHLDNSSINPRFTTMATTYDTNQKIYNWFMAGTTNQTADDALINSFRQAMINPV